MNEPVKLIECPRDAWQGLKTQIPAELKAAYLRELITAGFHHIDGVSFVSAKAVPQMADSEEVLKQLGSADGAEIIGIVVNERGAERAIATGSVHTLGYPCSISENFLRRNQNQSVDENLATLKTIKAMADSAKRSVVAYISMGFGNPYNEPFSEENVAEMAKAIVDLGVRSVSIADTVGVSETDSIDRVLSAVLNCAGGADVGVHLHSTAKTAGAKILAAYDAGCRRFDSAIGGLGGCPFAQDDLVGNIPTEEVLRALEQRGVIFDLTNKLAKVQALNAQISAEFGAGR
jgi:hydroxymethylglutaryl-CoA lyase